MLFRKAQNNARAIDSASPIKALLDTQQQLNGGVNRQGSATVIEESDAGAQDRKSLDEVEVTTTDEVLNIIEDRDEARRAWARATRMNSVPDVVASPLKYRRNLSSPQKYLHGDTQKYLQGDQTTLQKYLQRGQDYEQNSLSGENSSRSYNENDHSKKSLTSDSKVFDTFNNCDTTTNNNNYYNNNSYNYKDKLRDKSRAKDSPDSFNVNNETSPGNPGDGEIDERRTVAELRRKFQNNDEKSVDEDKPNIISINSLIKLPTAGSPGDQGQVFVGDVPPPPPDVAKSDLLRHLGLLLGDETSTVPPNHTSTTLSGARNKPRDTSGSIPSNEVSTISNAARDKPDVEAMDSRDRPTQLNDSIDPQNHTSTVTYCGRDILQYGITASVPPSHTSATTSSAFNTVSSSNYEATGLIPQNHMSNALSDARNTSHYIRSASSPSVSAMAGRRIEPATNRSDQTVGSGLGRPGIDPTTCRSSQSGLGIEPATYRSDRMVGSGGKIETTIHRSNRTAGNGPGIDPITSRSNHTAAPGLGIEPSLSLFTAITPRNLLREAEENTVNDDERDLPWYPSLPRGSVVRVPALYPTGLQHQQQHTIHQSISKQQQQLQPRPRSKGHVSSSSVGNAMDYVNSGSYKSDNRNNEPDQRINKSSISTGGPDADLAFDSAGLRMTYNPTFSPKDSCTGSKDMCTGSKDMSTDSVTSLISTSTGNSISPPSTWRLDVGGLSPQLYRSGGAVKSSIDQSAFIQRPRSVTAAGSSISAGGCITASVNNSNFGGATSHLTRGISEIGPVLSGSRGGGLHAGGRRSLGTRRVARYGGIGGSQSIDFNGKATSQLSINPVQPNLTRLLFEVVHTPRDSNPPLFIGREWLCKEIHRELMTGGSRSKGIVIMGSSGCGKTSFIEQLVRRSEFGDSPSINHDDIQSAFTPTMQQAPSTSITTSQSASALLSLSSSDSLMSLANRVVAFHFCQADNNITCTVPEFVHSIAAHLAQSTYLTGYRDRLRHEEQLRSRLTMQRCMIDPSRAFIKGVLEPLCRLRLPRPSGRGLDDSNRFILVDGLDEAAYHEPDYGGTIASFLADHLPRFPPWLKLIVTVRTGFQDAVEALGFSSVGLDGKEGEVYQDIYSYLDHRIQSSPTLNDRILDSLSTSNVHLSPRVGLNPGQNSITPNSTSRLCSHISRMSCGSMLYAKCVLDSLEYGPLVLKASNYKALPVSVSETFLMTFSVRFPTMAAFEKISPILNVCLASLYPLTSLEIFEALCAGRVDGDIGFQWSEFIETLDSLSELGLVKRRDTTYMFYHPAFRDWLLRREPGESTRFICDLRQGHALLALRLSRQRQPLTPERILELGHHILKAHIYRSAGVGSRAGAVGPRQVHDVVGRSISARDLPAHWLCLSADSFSSSLVCHRNLFTPNVKVSRLLLLAGASANARTDQLSNSPVVCVAAREGHLDMVALLIEFNADLTATGDEGLSALAFAAQRGHIKVIHLLITKLAKVNQMDFSNQCPLVHAANSGQLDACSFLLQCDWSMSRDRRPTRNEALQQSLVAAAANGHSAICKFLMGLQLAAGDSFNVNRPDSLLGETALTAACSRGHADTVTTLLRGVPGCEPIHLEVPNARGQLPLVCASASGHRGVIDRLLHPPRDRPGGVEGVDLDRADGRLGRTALIVAASEGHHSVVELLLDEGASVQCTDGEGLTALCWASLKGHLQCMRLLVAYGAQLDHADLNGRSPLHLAAFYGDERCVEYLLEKGAEMEREDNKGVRALDRAISCHNVAVVTCFLRRGAKLGPSTWTAASGFPDVLILLLNKLIDDGNTLYKRNRIKEAAHRYNYALRKFPQQESFCPADLRTLRDLKVNLLLNLSRCRRKLNDTSSAIELATSALEVKPRSFEAFYARARAKRDERQFTSALADLTEAARIAPDNDEVHRLILRINEESRTHSRGATPRHSVTGGQEGARSPQGSLTEGASSPVPSHDSACITTTPQATKHRSLPLSPPADFSKSDLGPQVCSEIHQNHREKSTGCDQILGENNLENNDEIIGENLKEGNLIKSENSRGNFPSVPHDSGNFSTAPISSGNYPTVTTSGANFSTVHGNISTVHNNIDNSSAVQNSIENFATENFSQMTNGKSDKLPVNDLETIVNDVVSSADTMLDGSNCCNIESGQSRVPPDIVPTSSIHCSNSNERIREETSL